MHPFSNVILLISFNYSHCVKNVDFLKKMYAPYFKTILFYSSELTDNAEVNHVYFGLNGIIPEKIFKHFHIHYKHLINESDGLFYCADDNLINLNILNYFSNDKIISGLVEGMYRPNNFHFLNDLEKYQYDSWPWWKDYNEKYGFAAIRNLQQDEEFKQFHITKYSRNSSDFFYLPKKYLTNTFFTLLELFGKYDVFHEIAIPTVINNIEPDLTKYHYYKYLWIHMEEQASIYKEEKLYQVLISEPCFAVHPIKLLNNDAMKRLLEKYNPIH